MYVLSTICDIFKAIWVGPVDVLESSYNALNRVMHVLWGGSWDLSKKNIQRQKYIIFCLRFSNS